MAAAAAAPSANAFSPSSAFQSKLSGYDVATLIQLIDFFVPPHRPVAPAAAAAAGGVAAADAKAPAAAAAPDTKSGAAAPSAAATAAPAASPATAEDPKAIPSWDAAAANPLEWQFIAASFPRLQKLLGDLKEPLALVRSAGTTKLVLAPKGGAASAGLSNAQLRTLQSDMVKFVGVPGMFDFVMLMDRVCRATMDCVMEWMKTPSFATADADVAKMLDAKAVAAIAPQAIAFNGGEMASYEVDFQAGFRVLMYPDVNKFTADHLAVLNAQKKARPYLDYSWDALCFPEHELMHCLQMELQQKDDSGWALEHDASRIAFVLTALIAEREAKNPAVTAANPPSGPVALFPPGKLEEICLYTARLVSHTALHDPTYTAAHAKGYSAWRDSWGVTPPVKEDSFTFVQQNQNVTDLFKYRVSLEAYCQAKMTGGNYETLFRALLETCFHKRTKGPITKTPVTIPAALVIDDTKYSLPAILTTRMSQPELDAFFKALAL